MNISLRDPVARHAKPWWTALHAALMPDYNRKAAGYWWTMVALGLVAVLFAAAQLANQPPGRSDR